MITYGVDKLLRMLKAHAYRYSFGFHIYALTLQHAVDIPGRMACSQYHRTFKSVARGGGHTGGCPVGESYIGDTLVEQNLSAAPFNSMPDAFYYFGQTVSAYMRMSVAEYRFLCAVLMEYVENLVD